MALHRCDGRCLFVNQDLLLPAGCENRERRRSLSHLLNFHSLRLVVVCLIRVRLEGSLGERLRELSFSRSCFAEANVTLNTDGTCFGLNRLDESSPPCVR